MSIATKVIGTLQQIFGITRTGTRTQFGALPVTADPLADNQITATALTQKPLVIQVVAGQTANAVEIQNSAGTLLASIDSTGAFNAQSGGVAYRLVGSTVIATGGGDLVLTGITGSVRAGSHVNHSSGDKRNSSQF